ncbi:MAG: antibiotic biosynthesis monooxygenase [Oscillospiraceae bacterium]|nr:antibiotic biosynthesis monooxygenase [Oscillospiraceae bacterium]
MIIVFCEAKIDPEKQAEFLERVNESGVIEATTQEEGNISYELAASAGKKGQLYVIERWENMAVLQAHMKGANFAAFGKMSMEYGIKTEIKLYQGEALN